MPLTITSFEPTHGQPGREIRIRGTEFTRGIRVIFSVDSESLSVTFQSATLVLATVPRSAQNGPIAVVNPDGTRATSAAAFTVDEPPDVEIINFNPTHGSTGTQVTIVGDGFASNMTVLFGTHRATTVQWHSAMKIVATVPAGIPRGSRVAIHVGPAVSRNQFTSD